MTWLFLVVIWNESCFSKVGLTKQLTSTIMPDILQVFSFSVRHSKLFLRQSFKGVHIFTVVDICWTTNFSLAFVIVFLSSLSFLLPFFIILTFCSYLLPSSLSVELFSSWPPSAYLFWFFIFFYTFSLLPALII